MDNNLSDLIGGLLSNPETLNKVMTLLPAVAQMMGSDNSNSSNSSNGKTAGTAGTIETTVVNPQSAPEPSNQNTAENLMANENVMAALKNLVTALSSANPASPPVQTAPPPQAAVQTAASQTPPSGSINNIANIANLLGQNNQNSQNSQGSQSNQNNQSNQIEKTLDTLKNISSATSPDSDHRTKLLLALKPFLKEPRQSKIDTAIKYMSAAKIFSMFGKNGFV